MVALMHTNPLFMSLSLSLGVMHAFGHHLSEFAAHKFSVQFTCNNHFTIHIRVYCPLLSPFQRVQGEKRKLRGNFLRANTTNYFLIGSRRVILFPLKNDTVSGATRTTRSCTHGLKKN